MSTQKLLTVNEAAELLGLAEVTLRCWIGQRKISVVRLGRAVRIAQEEVARMIEKGTVPARPENL
jgi:excisionase family DNA binding protein